MTIAPNSQWRVEGKAQFRVGNAFYRPSSQLARDLGVLAASLERTNKGRLRVLDAMAGCGVRSLRYVLESKADWVWVNDSNPDVSEVLKENLGAIAPTHYHLTHQDANRVFFDCYNHHDFYDLVDVDCFGSPAPYLSTSLWSVAINGLLYLTSTDGRSATGHTPAASLSAYGAYTRTHPAAHEQGLRLMIGSLQQQAAAKGLGIEPILSLFSGEIYRVLVRLVPQVGMLERQIGFLGYCHHCGDYQTIDWRRLGKTVCPYDQHPLAISGPLWLEPLHSPVYLSRMATLAEQWGWSDRHQLLTLMQAEAALPPYFYTLGDIGRRGKLDIPRRSHLIQTLQHWGFVASATHINAQAIKTTAPLKTCIEAALQR